MARRARVGRGPGVLVTCEHGGNLVPDDLAGLFRGRERVLASHRGWDPGALELAGTMARTIGGGAPLRFALVSRLVVDLNRSVGHPNLLSEYTAGLTGAERAAIVTRHYEPYRRDVEATVRAMAGRGARCVHVSVHTFTPVLRGKRRKVDIGVLFDPARTFESEVAERMCRGLEAAFPRLRVRANAPYRGTDDGLTTYLRTKLADARYAGIEIEVNQRFVRARSAQSWARMRRGIAAAVSDALGLPRTGRDESGLISR